ncbi:P-loop containing nucleoside triphosphate hydrolase protein [Usnea florida]
MSRLPFGKSKQTAQRSVDEEAAVDEKNSIGEEEVQQTREEQLASVIQDEEIHSDGEDCELHVYERRYDTRGEEVFLRAGTKSKIMPPKRKSHRACLVLNRHFDREGDFFFTELEIQSRHIVKALREVIGEYAGVDFTTKFVTIMEPPRCIFHYQDELRQYAEASGKDQLKLHMQLCLEYMEKTLHQEIKLSKAVMSNASLSPELEHRHLWMAFKPGCLVYEKYAGIETLSRLRSIYDIQEEDSERIKYWKLSAEIISYSGSDIGFFHDHAEIWRYDGCKPLCGLTAVPLHFHPEKERIRHDLLKRGRKFLSHCGTHHCLYDGSAIMHHSSAPEAGNFEILRVSVRHRIMLDLEQYKRSVANSSRDFIVATEVYHSGAEASSNLSEEDCMTCTPYLPGYSLELKKWGLFSVADITEVPYNDKAFEGLVLPENQKKLVASLLQRQDHQQVDGFDDLIKGKGKGLVFLLHGPPGVGKTYTAESIADRTRRPLLKINSGDLNRSVFGPEVQLADMFFLATRWSGITLLDEADVFMQKRTVQTLERNQLVSILLRVLEYNEGILFLTTNRVETIDHAFKSRIHLFIAYPPLSADARRELWTSAILRAHRGQTPDWLSTDFLHHLMDKKVNGREIKNIVRVGYSLARNENREMQTTDLLQGLESLEQFETDMAVLSEEGNVRSLKT